MIWSDTQLLKEAVGRADILINATRAGMSPLENVMPVPEEVLRPELAVADVFIIRGRRCLSERRKRQAAARRQEESECFSGRGQPLSSCSQDRRCR